MSVKGGERVETTNDSAVVSKYSMSTKGYALDPFLRHFVGHKHLKRSRSPLINRFYYLRFKAIEHLFSRCHRLDQIISFGCGFDTSSLRYPNIAFIEIDFPFVAKNKAKILVENQLIDTNEDIFIQNDINCDNSCEPIIVLRTHNYCLIGADLRETESLSKFFIENNLMKDLNKMSKIGLFNECSLCYLNQYFSDSLIKTFIALYEDKCHSITYLSFEQIKANQTNDGFTQVMLNHFQTIGSPLKTFLTKSQIINRFKVDLNFDSIEVLDMKTFFDDYIEPKEKSRIDCLEMFDEYEEFDSVCSVYALTIAQLVFNDNNSDNNVIETNSEIKGRIKAKCKPFEDNPLLSRFGHSSCLTSDDQIVVFGGFGCDLNSSRSHKRLSHLIKIDTKSEEIKSFGFDDKTNEMQRIHSKIVELKEDLFLISGGRLSPNKALNNKLIKLSQKSQTYESFEMTDNLVPKVFRHLIIKQIDAKDVIHLGGKQCHDYCGTGVEDNCYYVLDMNTMKWKKQILCNLFSGIHSHSGVSLDSNVFLTNGGLNCHNNSFSFNCLNLFDRRMSFVNTIEVKDLIHLYSHNIKVLNQNQIIIIGGMGKKGPNNRIDLLDLRSNQIMTSLDIITDSPQMLTNFSSEMIVSNGLPLLWLIGGGGNCFSFGTHFNKVSVLEIFL